MSEYRIRVYEGELNLAEDVPVWAVWLLTCGDFGVVAE